MHIFKAEQFLPIPIEKAWSFFSSPKNLSTITPPELGFKVRSKLTDAEIYEGMVIDYTVKPLLGIPVHWQTKIVNVDTLNSFTDTQLKGPYSIWEHTHTFKVEKNGIRMTDIVKYKLPMGIMGKLVEKWVVRKKIKNIFDFRTKTLENLFK